MWTGVFLISFIFQRLKLICGSEHKSFCSWVCFCLFGCCRLLRKKHIKAYSILFPHNLLLVRIFMLKKLGSVTGISTPFNLNRKRFIKEFRRLKEFLEKWGNRLYTELQDRLSEWHWKPGCREDLPTPALHSSKASSRDASRLPFGLHSDWPGPEISVNVLLGSRGTESDPPPLIRRRNSAAGSRRSAVCSQPLGSRKAQRRHLESSCPPEQLEKLKREK